MKNLFKAVFIGLTLISSPLAMNYEQCQGSVAADEFHDSEYMEGKIQATIINSLDDELEETKRRFSKRISELPEVLDIRFYVTVIEAIEIELNMLESRIEGEFEGPEAFKVGFDSIEQDLIRVNKLIDSLR